jgi:hypothetical protein
MSGLRKEWQSHEVYLMGGRWEDQTSAVVSRELGRDGAGM